MGISETLKKYSKAGNNKVFVHSFEIPLGKMIAGADDDFLYFVIFEDSKNIENTFEMIAAKLNCSFLEEKNKLLNQFENEVKDYFEGKLKKFTVPIKTFGSQFQKEVWDKLLEIPFGSTHTYGSLAKIMGRPVTHSRAVGAACGANTHLLVIPCHRLVASNSNGGFSCGLNRKEWLLKHEKKFA
ncbi:methylated-DNA--protein-cysteine methyltransferase, inducible [Melitaea cinxia]|uniref:methylated-DNA--protein-cysteine methyltransferase, inducible n=1 Tax=Melitaea cinxia TaxID=113334 RepID=UPI0004EA9ECC|nr:methylated-DNA--protein-cysteine methyltransferase, inducible [Melitaea cinxia]